MDDFESAVRPPEILEQPGKVDPLGPHRCPHGVLNFNGGHGSPAACCWLCRPFGDPEYAKTAKPVFFPRRGDFSDRERLHANTTGTHGATCPSACPECGSLLHTSRTRDGSGEWTCAECGHHWKPKR